VFSCPVTKIVFSCCPVTKEKCYKMRLLYLFQPEKKTEIYERMDNYQIIKKRTRLIIIIIIVVVVIVEFSCANFISTTRSLESFEKF
jgi:hypothetical protein